MNALANLRKLAKRIAVAAAASAYRAEAASQARGDINGQILDVVQDTIAYRAPSALGVHETRVGRVNVIGSCLTEEMVRVWQAAAPDVTFSHSLFVNFGQKAPTPEPHYDFHVVQLALQQLMGDAQYFKLPYSDTGSFEAFFAETSRKLELIVESATDWNRGRSELVFVLGFLVPQQNPRGRLMDRYDLRNVTHFVERLNARLEALTRSKKNMYFVDLDAIVSSYGRKFFQDDAVWSSTHGSHLYSFDEEHDGDRLEPPQAMARHYTSRYAEIMIAIWHELVSDYRLVKGDDRVKLVLFDLDDTLWRGTANEGGVGELNGWPRGIMEAVRTLKSRGIITGIVSKNDEASIVSRWADLTEGLVDLDDFTVRRINWRPKSENVREILEAVNLGAEAVVVVEDNPRERAEMSTQIPELRVIGQDPYYLKRILLWSAETQVPEITLESADRHTMVVRQLQREEDRSQMESESFLAQLDLRVSISWVDPDVFPRWTRVLELFNKTNQLNSRGIRYDWKEVQRRIAEGGRVCVMEVSDRYVQYGLVGAAWWNPEGIDHFVISCRVLGLGAEEAFLHHLVSVARADARHVDVLAKWTATNRNQPCWSLLIKSGFRGQRNDSCVRLAATDDVPVSEHVSIVVDGSPPRMVWVR